MIGMILFPAAFAVMDEDQVESLLTIMSSMVEARNKDLHKRLSAAIETIADEIGSGSADDMAAFMKRAQDPAFQQELASKLDSKINPS